MKRMVPGRGGTGTPGKNAGLEVRRLEDYWQRKQSRLSQEATSTRNVLVA